MDSKKIFVTISVVIILAISILMIVRVGEEALNSDSLNNRDVNNNIVNTQLDLTRLTKVFPTNAPEYKFAPTLELEDDSSLEVRVVAGSEKIKDSEDIYSTLKDSNDNPVKDLSVADSRCEDNFQGDFCGGCVNRCVTWAEMNAAGGGCNAVIDATCGGTGNSCAGDGAFPGTGGCCGGLVQCPNGRCGASCGSQTVPEGQACNQVTLVCNTGLDCINNVCKVPTGSTGPITVSQGQACDNVTYVCATGLTCDGTCKPTSTGGGGGGGTTDPVIQCCINGQITNGITQNFCIANGGTPGACTGSGKFKFIRNGEVGTCYESPDGNYTSYSQCYTENTRYIVENGYCVNSLGASNGYPTLSACQTALQGSQCSNPVGDPCFKRYINERQVVGVTSSICERQSPNSNLCVEVTSRVNDPSCGNTQDHPCSGRNNGDSWEDSSFVYTCNKTDTTNPTHCVYTAVQKTRCPGPDVICFGVNNGNTTSYNGVEYVCRFDTSTSNLCSHYVTNVQPSAPQNGNIVQTPQNVQNTAVSLNEGNDNIIAEGISKFQPRVASAVSINMVRKDPIRLRTMANQLGISEEDLQVRFQNPTGTDNEELIRIAREIAGQLACEGLNLLQTDCQISQTQTFQDNSIICTCRDFNYSQFIDAFGAQCHSTVRKFGDCRPVPPVTTGSSNGDNIVDAGSCIPNSSDEAQNLVNCTSIQHLCGGIDNQSMCNGGSAQYRVTVNNESPNVNCCTWTGSTIDEYTQCRSRCRSGNVDSTDLINPIERYNKCADECEALRPKV